MSVYESLLSQASELSPGNTLLVMIALSALPFFAVSISAFVKVTTLFSILRSALGLGQAPSQMVVATLALVLSGYVMMPVVQEVTTKLESVEAVEGQEAVQLYEIVEAPLREFLLKNAGEKEKYYFYSRVHPESDYLPEDVNLAMLVPAYMLTELREAFQLGLMLLIPFIIIDLVVATVLTGLGMVMVSPVTIALPFKVALFLASDGWLVISKGIVEGYLW